MVDTRLTAARIKNHFAYNFWVYLIVIVVAIFSWSMAYNLTAYRPPDDKKLDVYIAAAGADTDVMQQEWEPVFFAHFPDQEEIRFLYIGLGSDSDYSTLMQFSTYIAAGEGDLFLMPRDRFALLARDDAENNALLSLNDYIEQGVIDLRGIDVTAATFDGEVRGIPAASLYGLVDYGILPQSMYLAIPSYSANPDTAAAMIDLMIEKLLIEKPEWYDDYLRQVQMNLTPQQIGGTTNGS